MVIWRLWLVASYKQHPTSSISIYGLAMAGIDMAGIIAQQPIQPSHFDSLWHWVIFAANQHRLIFSGNVHTIMCHGNATVVTAWHLVKGGVVIRSQSINILWLKSADGWHHQVQTSKRTSCSRWSWILPMQHHFLKWFFSPTIPFANLWLDLAKEPFSTSRSNTGRTLTWGFFRLFGSVPSVEISPIPTPNHQFSEWNQTSRNQSCTNLTC